MLMLAILCYVYCYGTKIRSGSLYCVYTLLFCEFKVVKLNWCVLETYWVSGTVLVCVQQSQNLQFSLRRAGLA